MKKRLLIWAGALTLLAALVIVSCYKNDKQEMAPTSSISEGTTVTHESSNPDGKLTSRADCGMNCSCDCCCGLTLLDPTNRDIDIMICGLEIGCLGDDPGDCNFGGGNCATLTAREGGSTTLNTTTNPSKIFCSGGVNDVFEVKNLSIYTATFVIECGGTSSNSFILAPGEAAYIRKGTDCDIDPADPCIY